MRRDNAGVLWSIRSFPVLMVAITWMAGGCTQSFLDGAGRAAPPARCGVSAALDIRLPEAYRDNPPACGLPTGEDVALSCAVYDQVTSPGYRPPDYDEEGFPINAQPAPEYRVTDLSCDFSTPERNRASCRFRLARADHGEPRRVEMTFEHRFWQDHGPAHHVYGTRWSPTGRCLALIP